MPNSDTQHSRSLRAKTASKRKQRIIDEGGLELRVLLDSEYHQKLNEIVEYYSYRDKESRRSVILSMIDTELRAIKSKKSQLDAFKDDSPGISKPTKPPLIKYVLNENTWSGRGRKPMWVISYLNEGGKLEDIEIKNN